MDGKHLLLQLRQLLEEDAGSGFIDDFTSYQFLGEAAEQLVWETQALRATQSITTVADQAAYNINPDFLGLYLRNSSKQFVVKYSSGSDTSFITWKPYEDVIVGNNTTPISIPSRFTIVDNDTVPAQVSGTTTSAGAATGGQCSLTDTGADFSDVYAGDYVHNTTDGSSGVVLSKTSSTVLVTALFGGTNDDWTSADGYVIQPQGRLKLLFDPPPSTALHTATLYYLQRPAPVYSDYGIFRFPQHFSTALVKYAAWLYKYRDRDPNYGDKWYVYWLGQLGKYKNQGDHVHHRKRFNVLLRKS